MCGVHSCYFFAMGAISRGQVVAQLKFETIHKREALDAEPVVCERHVVLVDHHVT